LKLPDGWRLTDRRTDGRIDGLSAKINLSDYLTANDACEMVIELNASAGGTALCTGKSLVQKTTTMTMTASLSRMRSRVNIHIISKKQ